MPSKHKQESISTPAATPAHRSEFSLISPQKLLQLYSTMVKCRMIEERVQSVAGRRKSAAGDRASSGNEAVIAGAAIDLGPEDVIVSLHAELMAGFVKGTPIDELFRRLSPRSTRSSKARPTPAAQLKSAVEAALAGKKDRSGNIAVVFSRRCAAASSPWRNALTLARRKMLPMIFVCHSDPPHAPESNSPRAAMEERSRRPSRGFPTFRVDGNDIVAVYRVAHEAIARARKNRGPTLIECAPLCLSGRSGNRGSSIRNVRAVKRHETTDPILIMENYLAAKGLFTAGMKHRIARGFRRELNAALASGSPVSDAESNPVPGIHPMKTQ
jgi:acetoin:2,6-dichlorophenolindophenol oxidoreductase subunit alpha